MKLLPKARNKDIIVQTVGKELMLYDLTINKALILNETSTLIYQACDGKTSSDELKRHDKNITGEIIHLALDQLNKENLLENPENYESIFQGLSRREVIRRVGMASLVALPIISSIVAPASVHAESCKPEGSSCSFFGFTQSDCCYGQRCNDSSICQPCVAPGIDLPETCVGDGCCRMMPVTQLCCFQPVSQGGPPDKQYCHCR